MAKPKMFDFEPTEKGKLALAYALVGFLAQSMDQEDLIEYYIDTQAAFYANNPAKLKEDLEIHGENMLEFIGEMNKRLK